MNYPELLAKLKAGFPGALLAGETPPASLDIPREQLRPLLQYLKQSLAFDYLVFTTALDRMAENKLEALYYLHSHSHQADLLVRVRLDRSQPVIDTVCDLYRTAEWHEREAAEMFGITYLGHPDPRKLLMPDEITGYPLRKDFKDDFMLPIPTNLKGAAE
jgi:NADH:ubiquinone oxidoreductase subunit C